ncbi:helix-turn-helix domain-containing protein [Pelagibacterium lentulum]|uniref:Resolvase/invertase-type recombinase catalytic domain-containing protein n=1 Tax=Pelagibacterium lentulum TaxID=2029865 RepID=A0A916RND1_9HYPH|nr:hypothetical protein GCM10011499_35000 [Pelagibacterium lentulum]
MAALAEFERSLISERTKAGMEVARLNGGHLGRRPALTEHQARMAAKAVSKGEAFSVIAKRFGVTPRTLRRYMNCRLNE